ncbi:MAG: hypothetical protein KDB82_14365 [Planctomycetes bacterium]|nr:hypothetical protein [Planctomycetota bacterium]
MTDAPAEPSSEKFPALTRGAHHLYYLYAALVPTLAVIGLLNLEGSPAANVSALFAVPVLGWVLRAGLMFGMLMYIALAIIFCTPPRSPLVTLFVVFDVPVLVFLGSLAGQGPPDFDVLAYDGLIETVGACLGMVPGQFIGQSLTGQSGKNLGKDLALLGAFAAAPVVILGALLIGLAEDGAWLGLVTGVIATGWSIRSYARLRAARKTHEPNWAWMIIGVIGGLAGGVAFAVISANG